MNRPRVHIAGIVGGLTQALEEKNAYCQMLEAENAKLRETISDNQATVFIGRLCIFITVLVIACLLAPLVM